MIIGRLILEEGKGFETEDMYTLCVVFQPCCKGGSKDPTLPVCLWQTITVSDKVVIIGNEFWLFSTFLWTFLCTIYFNETMTCHYHNQSGSWLGKIKGVFGWKKMEGKEGEGFEGEIISFWIAK